MKPLRLFSSGQAREMVDAFEKMLRQKRLVKNPHKARLQAMLMHASLSGRHQQARQILAAGADPNSRFPRGTALGEAINRERTEMVRALLEAGANPNLPSNKMLPLTMACEHGLHKIIQLLVEAGVSVQPLGKKKGPALLDAASCGCIPLAKKLLAAGVPVDFLGKHGRGGAYSSIALPRTWQTPLMLAAFYGYPEMVTFLIEAGADVNRKDGKGHSAVDYARILKLPNSRRIVKILEAANAASSKPFEEPVSGIPDFSQAAKEPRFQKLVAKLKKLTKRNPLPLCQLLGDIRGGYGFQVAEDAASKLVKKHHREFLKDGSYLFFSRHLTAKNGPVVAILPTTELSLVVTAVGTEGPDDNMYNPQVIAWLKALKKEQKIDILGLGHDFIEGYFTGPIKNADALARNISKICAEAGDEPAAIRNAAARMKKTKRLFIWWD